MFVCIEIMLCDVCVQRRFSLKTLILLTIFRDQQPTKHQRRIYFSKDISCNVKLNILCCIVKANFFSSSFFYKKSITCGVCVLFCFLLQETQTLRNIRHKYDKPLYTYNCIRLYNMNNADMENNNVPAVFYIWFSLLYS